MPIHPDDKKRYPKNWKEISLSRRENAGWRCEWCNAEHGKPNPATGSRVILTVAHLDHMPENCSPDNLRALCQKCHLNYDANHHRQSRMRRNKISAAQDVSALEMATEPAGDPA